MLRMCWGACVGQTEFSNVKVMPLTPSPRYFWHLPQRCQDRVASFLANRRTLARAPAAIQVRTIIQLLYSRGSPFILARAPAATPEPKSRRGHCTLLSQYRDWTPEFVYIHWLKAVFASYAPPDWKPHNLRTQCSGLYITTFFLSNGTGFPSDLQNSFMVMTSMWTSLPRGAQCLSKPRASCSGDPSPPRKKPAPMISRKAPRFLFDFSHGLLRQN